MKILFTFLITLSLSLNTRGNDFNQLLKDNSVYCMDMDRDNILWIGTEEGLIKYDSKQFRYYFYDPLDTTSLLDNSIRSILIDSKNRIWLGTRNGLNLYNPEKDNFHRFIPSNEANELNGSFITSISEDPDGYIWIGTEACGLNRLDPETWKFNHFKANNTPSSIISDNIEDIELDDNGGLWIATKEGIDFLDINTGEISHYYHKKNVASSLPSNDIAVLKVDKNGFVWSGSRDGFLCYLDKNEGLHYIKNDFSVTALSRSGDTIIIGTNKGGIRRINSESLSEVNMGDFIVDDPDGLGAVRCLYTDKWDNLWVGSENGLFVDYSIRRKFHGVKGNTAQLPLSSVRTLLVDHLERLWVVNESEILIKQDDEFIDFRSLIKSGDKSELKRIYSIFQDSEKYIWIGSFDKGLFRFNPSTGYLKHYKHDPEDPKSLPDNCIWTITEDYNSNLWIGSWGGGLIHYNREKDNFSNYRVSKSNSNSLSNNKLISLETDSEGIIWIGTDGGGLNRFNPLVDRFESFTPRPNDLNSITDRSILCIYEDSNKQLWIGTDGGGLLRMDRKNNTFKVYNHNHGLSNSSVKSIIEDPEGKLWLATNGGGIFMFQPSEEIFIQFTSADGLSSNRFFNGAVSSDSNGNFYFGGVSGYTSFHPLSIETDNLNPKVIIKSININNKDQTYSEDFNFATTNWEKIINLKPSHKIISVDFAAVEYSPSKRNRYRYRLTDLNEQWIDLGEKSSVSFMNLPHGDYKLEIQCSNTDGIWSSESEVLKLNILPPFYRTPWFILGLLFAIALIFYFWNVLKLKELRDRGKLLSAMVDERTREVSLQAKKLSLQNAELEKQKAELALKNDKIIKSRERLRQMTRKVHESDEMKLRFFTNISHEFRTPVTLILAPLENLINQFKYDDQALDHLLTMRRNAGRLLRLIGQVMEFRKLDTGKLRLRAAKEDLSLFTRNITDSFKEYVREKQIAINFVSRPKSIHLYFDPDKLEKILYNLLSNAIRFTPKGGKVELLLEEIDSDLTDDGSESKPGKVVRITVSDNGKGIPAHEQENIFERFYQVENPVYAANSGGSGIGLALTKDLVKLHKGEIAVESKEGEGTKFIITLPAGRSHLSDNEIIEKLKPTKLGNEHLHYTLLLDSDNRKMSDPPLEENERAEKLRLLIVEDNLDLRRYLARYFSKNFSILEAGNGKEAYDLCRRKFPDIMISDIIMPEMDGLELCNAVKNDPETCHIPVILLTAKDSDEDHIAGLEKEADAYITKPLSPVTLSVTVENLLRNRKKLQNKYRRDILLEPENIELESNDEILLKKAMDVVEENISNSEFNVNLMSREIGVSRAALYRKLKALTNQSVNVFVRDIRLKRAAQILLQDKVTISEVAYMVGYNDVQYFRKCFTRFYKITPSQYIDKNKQEKK